MQLDVVGGYQKIVTIILLIAVGFLLKRKNIITKEIQDGLSTLLLKVIIPFAVFSSFLSEFKLENLKVSLVLLGISFVFFPLAQFGINKIAYLWEKDPEKKRLFCYASTYPNAGFMGLPFVQALFGSEGLFFASVFNLPYNIWLWSAGYASLTKQKMNKEGIINTVTNPVILACVFGYVWWFIQRFVPTSADTILTPIWDVFKTVGACNTPLSMMVIGAMLADCKISAIFSNKEIWYFSLIKLIVMPASLFVVLYLCGYTSWILAIPVVICSMPTCAAGGILAIKANVKPQLAASLITFTTMLSAVTIPIWLIILINIMM
ncbi:MAG: AEC family transporter [Lachnospiraceae bacterium]